MSDRPTYIYALCEPGTEVAAGEIPPPDAVRYVGKTVQPQRRYHVHITVFGRTHRSSWIRKCTQAGTPPMMAVIEMLPVGADWQEAERRWIAHYKVLGADLTNGTIGGDGVIDPTGEIRAKVIASQKKTWSAPERRAALSAKAVARWQDPEQRAKMLNNRDPAVHRAAMSNPEVRAKLSISHKAAWADPKKRAAILANRSDDSSKARKRLERLAAAEAKEQLKLPLD